MMGLVFTELVEFVADRYGSRTVEAILAEAKRLPSGGRYSALETYDHGELIQLVDHLAVQVGERRAALLEGFGRHLFAHFAVLYPVFFVGVDSAFDLLGRINTYVHDEVKKIYPEADFPRFECSTPAPGRLEMRYGSSRPLADLAEGLIRGCIAHFGEDVTVHREDGADDGYSARFVLVAPGGRS